MVGGEGEREGEEERGGVEGGRWEGGAGAEGEEEEEEVIEEVDVVLRCQVVLGISSPTSLWCGWCWYT